MLPAGTTNAVVLTGFGAQVAGLAEMLHTVDANSGPQRQLAVLRLQHADARWVGNALQIVLGTPRAGGEDAPSPPERFRIATDERINALVVAADPATMADIERLVAELDVAAE